MIFKRQLEPVIKSQATKFPILAVTGPRQSGKTTMLRELFSDYRYVSLENPDIRAFASDDPIAFLNEYNDQVILDEVQRVPELFSYLQTKVDESKKMGQYILSGSQNFHLLSNITQTLSGRVALFKLLPFDLKELKKAKLLPSNYEKAILEGFYPAIFDRNIEPRIFYANYIQTYVEKDVTELENIKDLKNFRVFLSLCAGRIGQLLNINALANDCNISQPTAKAWLSILESRYILFLQQPYYENFNKRLVKTPKLYFYDTGLVCFLLGIKTPGDITENRLKGNLFENLIVAEFHKQNYHQYTHLDYYFWQDSNANEVDILSPTDKGYNIYEIKATTTINPALFKQMDKFASLATTKEVNKTLVYGGLKNQKRTQYTILSWADLNL